MAQKWKHWCPSKDQCGKQVIYEPRSTGTNKDLAPWFCRICKRRFTKKQIESV